MTVRILPLAGLTLGALLLGRRRATLTAVAADISARAERRANALEAQMHEALARGDEQYADLLDAAWREQIALCADAAHDARDVHAGVPANRIVCCYVTDPGRPR